MARRPCLVATVSQCVLLISALLSQGRADEKGTSVEPSGDASFRRGQERVDRIRESLARKSLDELVADLKDDSGYYWPGYRSEQSHDQADFETILSNRLTWRILDILSTVPRSEALAKGICVQAHKEHRSAIEAILTAHESGVRIPADRRQSVLGTKFGLGAAIFVLAHFAGPDRVVEELQRMHECADRYRDRLQEHADRYSPSYRSATRVYWELDNVYQFNAIAFAAERNGALDPSRRQRIRDLLSALPSTSVVITHWDAKVSSYDIAHVVHRRPIDETGGTQTLKVYQFTPGMLYRDSSNQENDLVAALWKLCGKSE